MRSMNSVVLQHFLPDFRIWVCSILPAILRPDLLFLKVDGVFGREVAVPNLTFRISPSSSEPQFLTFLTHFEAKNKLCFSSSSSSSFFFFLADLDQCLFTLSLTLFSLTVSIEAESSKLYSHFNQSIISGVKGVHTPGATLGGCWNRPDIKNNRETIKHIFVIDKVII